MTSKQDIFKESINVFRYIRRYTESFGKAQMKIDDLYEAMGDIIQKKLFIDVVIYRRFGENQTFKQVYASPMHQYLPKSICIDDGFHPEDGETFEGSWWLIPFGNIQTFEGYVGLHVDLQGRTKLPPGSIFVDNDCITKDCHKGKTEDQIEIEYKGYFVDLIMNVIEHFESALTQIVILKRNNDLIQELKEQNEALLRAREENKSAVRQGREWVSIMSHEIRTPLFAINSLAELLLDKFKDDDDDAEVMSSLNLIVNSGKHLSELINNILDFTKLESDQLQLEYLDFEIRTLINDCVAINVRNDQRMYPHTCIFIDKSVPKTVIGDELRVKQIVMNLINNAVKFTPDDGAVHLYVSSECIYKYDKSMVRLTFELYDTGIGIKLEDYDKVFKPFTQTDTSITRKFGGSGLGLSICKKLCHMMDGDIYFEPNDIDNKGTKFTFHILLAINMEKEHTKIVDLSKEIPDEIQKWRILVIDDSEISRKCTKNHLSHFNITNVTTMSNLPYIQEEKSKEDYDVYFINTRTKSVIENIDLLKRKVHEQQDRVILQNYPYAKKMLDLNVPIMAEIFGPVTERELKMAFIKLAERRNIIESSIKSDDSFPPLNAHILVAEDNMINQNVIKRMLNKFKVTADFAENGKIALDLFKKDQEKYKVILMDIMMPVMDGYSASTEIRKLCRDSKVPYIVALTANVFWEDRLRAMQSGMNAFVTKPVKLHELHSILYKALNITDESSSSGGMISNTNELR